MPHVYCPESDVFCNITCTSNDASRSALCSNMKIEAYSDGKLRVEGRGTEVFADSRISCPSLGGDDNCIITAQGLYTLHFPMMLCILSVIMAYDIWMVI